MYLKYILKYFIIDNISKYKRMSNEILPIEMVFIIMDDKTPQQLLIEHLDFIKRTIKKINYVKNYNLNEDDIEDIFQNVCFKLFLNGIANYKGKSKFKTYLFKIIRNSVISYVNKKNKFIRQVDIDSNQSEEQDDDNISIFDLFHPVSIDFTDEIVKNDILNIIKNTLDTFDEKDKLIYTWYFLYKKTQAEVAQMIKLSQPSVYERIEKIKKRILSAVKKKYPEVEEEILS